LRSDYKTVIVALMALKLLRGDGLSSSGLNGHGWS
jgi:hypothetical protein